MVHRQTSKQNTHPYVQNKNKLINYTTEKGAEESSMKRGILQRHVRMGTASWREARSSARKEEKDFNSRGSLTGTAVQTRGLVGEPRMHPLHLGKIAGS